MNKILIAGNWKMNTNVFESEKLVEYVVGYTNNQEKLNCEVLVCPPFTSLFPINKLISNSPIKLGSQNCHFEPQGAFTGEVSIDMLKHCGVSHVIIGHSERRTIFGENDELINKKLIALLNADVTPILCIGETLEEREQGNTFDVLGKQSKVNLAGVCSDNIDKIVIAYEPVWAIGTGITATTEQINEAHDWLRRYLIARFGVKSEEMCLLYGGSMNPANADEILACENVNGGLIGGASLKGDAFCSIIESANKINL